MAADGTGAATMDGKGDGRGFAWCETAVGAATAGLVRVRVGRCVDPAAARAAPPSAIGTDRGGEAGARDALLLGFVLRGSAILEVEEIQGPGGETEEGSHTRQYGVERHDCFCVPPGFRWRLLDGEELEVLEMRVGATEDLKAV